ncbi:MAG: hypothetical protein AAFR83_17825 [Cyanobacteria bacterium J06629_18]
MGKKNRKAKKDKTYKESEPSEEESDFDESDSESTSDSEDGEDEIMQDAQGWPTGLEDYLPTNSEQEVIERVNALFNLYKEYTEGKRTAVTLTKGELVNMADIGNHMVKKPHDKRRNEWLTTKIVSLVESKKKKKKKTQNKDMDNSSIASTTIDLTGTQSQTIQPSPPVSQSILAPPPPTSQATKRPMESPGKNSDSPTKKAKAFFTTNQGDGAELVNGFPINAHPKQHKKKPFAEPSDVQVTEAYAVDDDMHL